MSEATTNQAAGGVPRGLSVGESWEAMLDELESDRLRGSAPSAGRQLVKSVMDPSSFSEIGGLVGSTRDLPETVQSVVGGWGMRGGKRLFVVSDEMRGGVAWRSGAGTVIAGNVHTEAFRSGGALLTVAGARRVRPEVWPAAAFMRLGLQVDIGMESESSRTIAKALVLAGSVDRVALIEAQFNHYVVASRDAAIELPDGETLDGTACYERGWADALADTAADAAERAAGALDLLPGNGWTEAETTTVTGPDDAFERSLDGWATIAALADGDSTFGLARGGDGTSAVALARVGGRPVGLVAGQPSTQLDGTRVERLVATCAVFRLPIVVVGVGADALEHAPLIVAVTDGDQAVPASSAIRIQLAPAEPSRADAVVEPSGLRAALAEIVPALATLAEARTEVAPVIHPRVWHVV